MSACERGAERDGVGSIARPSSAARPHASGAWISVGFSKILTGPFAQSSRLPLADLQNAKKVQLLAQRYLMTKADAAGGGGTGGSPFLSLFA
jgi:hypothetical protein